MSARTSTTTPTAATLRSVLETLSRLSADPSQRREALSRLLGTAFTQVAQARGMGTPLPVDPVVEALLEAHQVCFAGVDPAELGYLYESLLEPDARKSAGAHYTPRSLADEVVEHALEPLVAGAATAADLLDLRVVDIAAGSGVFLIAAAEFLAARVEAAWAAEGIAGRSAVRAVVTQCLYGADIDGVAVQIARRSLWLLAGDPALPLDFLDQHVLEGNALLGVLEPRLGWSLPVADAWVATGLTHGGKPGPELDAASARFAAAVAADDEDALDRIRSTGLTPTVPTGFARWRPVHWGLVAPAVMERGGFDAVIGNPPFLGVKNIRSALGQNLRDYLARSLLAGESGRSDLVVFFVAQAARLSRRTVGLVLPDAIAEGDSGRHAAAATQARGFRIYRAETSRPWPASAGVRIALLWWERSDGSAAGSAAGSAVLDGAEVEVIGPGLGRSASAGAVRRREPPAWMPHGYQATIVLGKSLVLTRDQAAAITAEDPRAAAWIRDYLSGDDLVSTQGPRSTRQVLDLGAVEEEVWSAVAPVARHLREVVLPERTRQWPKYPHLVERWWRFHNRVDRLYDAMDGLTEVVALAKHAKYIWPVLVPVGPVISNGAIVYPTQDRAVYGFLASAPHRLWAVEEGGSRLNQSHRYNPSRLLGTYPFPEHLDGVRDAGEQLAAAVADAGEQQGCGVTDLLNQVHGATPVPGEIRAIREAVVEVDRAVVAAHEFGIELRHGLWTAGERTWFGLDATSTDLLRARLLTSDPGVV